MTKRSRNRAFEENTIKKINLVMTPNSDEFFIIGVGSRYLMFRIKEVSFLYERELFPEHFGTIFITIG